MTLALFQSVLCYALAINYTILLLWFFVFCYARQFLLQLHRRWFELSDARFDAIHYAGMSLYKIIILAFNLAPCLALYLMRAPST